ncbi:MAG: isoleucine--tRNA ligase [Acidimicrobiia bacterium]
MSSRSSFQRARPQVDFPALEQEILDLWDDRAAFQASIDRRADAPEYVFYDGPPFPTGSPHFGTLLASVLKDVVPRYWTMRGFRVERRFGWDTHGLPIEMEVEKSLGISGPRQIAEYGIDRYNEACRAHVQANTENWRRVIRRIGRWVDMDNDYRTMDTDFMETVWWAVRQLWDKGLVYRDFKVLPYSWGATTPLSNFEVNLGGYRDVDDPSVTVKLKVRDTQGAIAAGDFLLVWTTTPWTLPANLAVAIGPDIAYVAFEDGGSRHWMARRRLDSYFKEPPPVLATAQGVELLGVAYDPPFDYFAAERGRGAFRVIAGAEVSTEDGTGLVHMAPAYGEADFAALAAAGLDVLVDPIDLEGRFTDAVPEVAGINLKEADPTLVRLLKEKGALFRNERIRHPYPFCYRTDTPLMYKAIPTWFIGVESIKDRLVKLNDNIHWVPEHVGTRRFGNWLADARDWAISRNRYWGSCIPVWECPSGHMHCVGSIEELEKLSGVRLTDLHKHFVDPVTFPCPECGEEMRRVPEVLDCWFESGSMPYGQVHYPFENRERFESTFPAQFIAEGLDQTRGWFYTLHVLGAALFDSEAFRNCVVNGLILSSDGRKMSKSLKNYDDPTELLETHGADALRAYLINSPVLRAEPVRFQVQAIREVTRTVLLPLWNAHSFFTTYAAADGITGDDLQSAPPPGERPELDRWILSVLQSLIADVNRQMEGYYLYNVVPPVLAFVADLTNWYVRRSRRRFWRRRGEDDLDKLAAFATLYEVLTTFVAVVAPVLPFISERIYQDLVREIDPAAPTSVHHRDYPDEQPELIDRDLERAMSVVRDVVSLGHGLRKQHEIKVRRPLASITVVTHHDQHRQAVADHADLIADELNVKEVQVTESGAGLLKLSAKPDFARLGPRFGARVKEVATFVAGLGEGQIESLLDGNGLEVADSTITGADLVIDRQPEEGMAVAAIGGLAVALSMETTPALLAEGLAREFVSKVQQERRQAGLDVSDRIAVAWWTDDETLAEAVSSFDAYIKGEVLATRLERAIEWVGERSHLDGAAYALSVQKASG